MNYLNIKYLRIQPLVKLSNKKKKKIVGVNMMVKELSRKE